MTSYGVSFIASENLEVTSAANGIIVCGGKVRNRINDTK